MTGEFLFLFDWKCASAEKEASKEITWTQVYVVAVRVKKKCLCAQCSVMRSKCEKLGCCSNGSRRAASDIERTNPRLLHPSNPIVEGLKEMFSALNSHKAFNSFVLCKEIGVGLQGSAWVKSIHARRHRLPPSQISRKIPKTFMFELLKRNSKYCALQVLQFVL